MGNEPLVTIGITCYNAHDTIVRSIASAVAQDWDNKEIIIVDDCSMDNSVSVIADYIKNIPNAKLYRHEQNKKPSGARNTIIKHACGEYIAFFDDDDVSLPNRISEQYQSVQEYIKDTGYENVACYASGERHYSNGYIKPLVAIGSVPECPKGTDIVNYLLFYKKRDGVFYGGGTPSCSLFIARKLLDKVGGFDEDFVRVEDAELAIRLGYLDVHFIGTREKIFIQHATVGQDKTPEKNRDAEIKMAEKHKEYLLRIKRYNYARLWPELRYCHFTRHYIKFFVILIRLFLQYPIPIIRHFCATVPKRFLHENKMKEKI